MGSKLTPQQELTAAMARLSALAGKVDSAVGARVRFGSLLYMGARRRNWRYGLLAAAVLAAVTVKRLRR